MAKRIKVTGKTPRGLSKAQRIKIAPLQRKLNALKLSESKRVDPFDMDGRTADLIDRLEYQIDDIAERPDISHGSSSKHKRRVKEGNRKFIGPRRFESELAEDTATRFRKGFGPRRDNKPIPAYVMRNVGKKGTLPRISGPKPKKNKPSSDISQQAKRLMELKKLAQSGQLPPEIARMLRDVPEI